MMSLAPPAEQGAGPCRVGLGVGRAKRERGNAGRGKPDGRQHPE